MAVNGVSTQPMLPKPLRAIFPDGGAPVDDHDVESGFILTAHADGVFRLWRIDCTSGDWAYYPIQVVGMTPAEILRSLEVACKLLKMPMNRKARRAMA